MLDFVLRYPFFYQFSTLAKREKAALKILHGFTESVIRKRRQELLNLKINNNEENIKENEEIGIKKKQAFLDILLQSTIDGQPLSDLDVCEEVDTFMFEVLYNINVTLHYMHNFNHLNLMLLSKSETGP